MDQRLKDLGNGEPTEELKVQEEAKEVDDQKDLVSSIENEHIDSNPTGASLKVENRFNNCDPDTLMPHL